MILIITISTIIGICFMNRDIDNEFKKYLPPPNHWLSTKYGHYKKAKEAYLANPNGPKLAASYYKLTNQIIRKIGQYNSASDLELAIEKILK